MKIYGVIHGEPSSQGCSISGPGALHIFDTERVATGKLVDKLYIGMILISRVGCSIYVGIVYAYCYLLTIIHIMLRTAGALYSTFTTPHSTYTACSSTYTVLSGTYGALRHIYTTLRGISKSLGDVFIALRGTIKALRAPYPPKMFGPPRPYIIATGPYQFSSFPQLSDVSYQSATSQSHFGNSIPFLSGSHA